jgi:hypothetical protein
MRLLVVHDEEGNIFAAAIPLDSDPAAGGIKPGPGECVSELDAAELDRLGGVTTLPTVLSGFRLRVGDEGPVLVPREPSSS